MMSGSFRLIFGTETDPEGVVLLHTLAFPTTDLTLDYLCSCTEYRDVVIALIGYVPVLSP